MEEELALLHRSIKQTMTSIVSEQSSNGVMLSNWTINKRIEAIRNILIEELSEIAEDYNSRSEQRKILDFVDEEIKNEKRSLEKLFKGTSIGLTAKNKNDFNTIKPIVIKRVKKERRKKWINISILIITAATLVATIATPVILYYVQKTEISQLKKEGPENV